MCLFASVSPESGGEPAGDGGAAGVADQSEQPAGAAEAAAGRRFRHQHCLRQREDHPPGRQGEGEWEEL